jgi:hypothetical protein
MRVMFGSDGVIALPKTSLSTREGEVKAREMANANIKAPGSDSELVDKQIDALADRTDTVPFKEKKDLPVIQIDDVSRETSFKEGEIPLQLSEEAKKYKSAEEFVKSQKLVYHGTLENLDKFESRGTWFTDDYMNADGYAAGENVYEGYLDLKNPLVIDGGGKKWDDLDTEYGKTTQEIVRNVDQKKYDGIIFENIKDNWIDDADAQDPGTVMYAFDPTVSFLNESQLTELYNSVKNISPENQILNSGAIEELKTSLREQLPENLKNNFDGFTRDETLSPKDLVIQEESIGKYLREKDELLEKTLEENGKIANTDEQRKFFKDVGYNGRNSAAVQEAASQLNKDQWRSLLKNNPEENAILFAGGSGSGKTSVARKLIPEDIENAAAILDGNLSTLSSARKRIAEAIANGKTVEIVYVYRDPEDAWVNGVIKRMLQNPNEGGRVVPMSVFLENHKGSRDVVLDLADDPDVDNLTLINNSKGAGGADFFSSIDEVRQLDYSDIESKLLQATKELLENGKITKEQYEALVG